MSVSRSTFLRGAGAAAAFLGGGAPVRAAALKPLASPTRVSVRFNWTMKGEFAPFVVARDKGFYKSVNIEPDLAPGKSGTQAAQVVGTGNDHFAYLPSVQLIEAIHKGIPLRAVAACDTYTGMCWTSRHDVPLTSPKSLEGRRVSISPSSTFFQVWDAFAKTHGIDQSKVTVISADPSARVGLFLNKQVEIMADIFIANDYVVIEKKLKEPLNLFRLQKTNFDPLGYLLVTNTQLMDKEPNMVADFTGATLQGLRYTREHPDEAASIMSKAYGDALGADVIKGQIERLLPLINDKPVYGKNLISDWERSLGILQRSGIIEKRFDHGQYYTNAFITG
ncbi:MAG: ABC transporter substrate-binding protein [Candidatus Elarobacter sp.]